MVNCNLSMLNVEPLWMMKSISGIFSKKAFMFQSSSTFHLLYSLSQPLLPVLTDTYGRNYPPLCSNKVQLLHPGASLKCWFSYLPMPLLQSFLQALAAPALNRQSLQTSGNLYTPVSGHGRCISNCQCALPDALLSFDPIHSSGCVPVAVIYTPYDFTDV